LPGRSNLLTVNVVYRRKEFKLLLKWRLKIREKFGFPTKKTTQTKATLAEEVGEVAAVEPMDEELKIQEELQALKDRDSSKRKREKRKENEKKQKDIVRMQLHMVAPMDIGMDQSGPSGEDAMFALKPIDKSNAISKVSKGKMAIVTDADARKDRDSGFGSLGDTDDESDEEEDRLERELDGLYDQFKERKAESDAKYRAKKIRKEHEDGIWEGVSGDEGGSSGDDIRFDQDSSDESDDEQAAASKQLLTDLDNTPSEAGGLSKRANNFFSQDIFKDMAGILDEPEPEVQKSADIEIGDGSKDEPVALPKKRQTKTAKKQPAKIVEESSESEDDRKDGFETVKNQVPTDDWEDEPRNKKSDGRIDIDIVTAEAMTLAHQLATGQKSNYDVVDDGYNKHAFRDRDGLPDWFVEEESKHDRPHRPITKAAANAIKEKLRAYNARPIKKVREAKARKKFKTAQRLEKLKKKSDLLANEEGMTEKEKADSIQKLMSKAGKKKPRENMKVVVAKGLNKGVKGRPKGVKGRYKIVDARMKKEMRAMKRIAKRK
jgi:AdoMet-dependent rRNA methyltransferase SPB1